MATSQFPEAAVKIDLTAAATEKVKEFMRQEKVDSDVAGLRVSVLPGGCSGFQYGLNIEEEPQEDDFVVLHEGVRVFVDAFSAQYLSGLSIDYRETFQGSGFAFENPNATGGCGCGSSFTA